MVDFRYAQFCPLTRAAEILGERWTILILRELFLGPKRFGQLKSALNGISTSVLSERLSRLEERRIVARRELPPPAVYELDEAGRAMQPLLTEMTRWGLRFLGAPGPDDRLRPEWLLLGLQVFARADATDDVGVRLHVDGDGDGESVDIYVRGGSGGTTVSRAPMPHDVTMSAPPVEMLLFANGLLAPDAGGKIRWEGDADSLRRVPSLFDFRPTAAASPAPRAVHSTDQRAARARRRKPRPVATGGQAGESLS